jgi:hypothetical protein
VPFWSRQVGHPQGQLLSENACSLKCIETLDRARSSKRIERTQVAGYVVVKRRAGVRRPARWEPARNGGNPLTSGLATRWEPQGTPQVPVGREKDRTCTPNIEATSSGNFAINRFGLRRGGRSWSRSIERSLVGEIDPSKTYSYEYLCYRITDYRPELSPQIRLVGRGSAARRSAVCRGRFGCSGHLRRGSCRSRFTRSRISPACFGSRRRRFPVGASRDW